MIPSHRYKANDVKYLIQSYGCGATDVELLIGATDTELVIQSY